jgi:hypothetical protein
MTAAQNSLPLVKAVIAATLRFSYWFRAARHRLV